METRALVVLYHGGEISQNSLQQIKYLISTDYNAIGQDIVCVELKAEEIAQLSAEAAAKIVAGIQQNSGKPQVHINVSSKRPTKLENACKLLADKVGIQGADPLKVVAAYLSDKEVHDAIRTIASARQRDIENNNVANAYGVNNHEFLEMIRQIAKNL